MPGCGCGCISNLVSSFDATTAVMKTILPDKPLWCCFSPRQVYYGTAVFSFMYIRERFEANAARNAHVRTQSARAIYHGRPPTFKTQRFSLAPAQIALQSSGSQQTETFAVGLWISCVVSDEKGGTPFIRLTPPQKISSSSSSIPLKHDRNGWFSRVAINNKGCQAHTGYYCLYRRKKHHHPPSLPPSDMLSGVSTPRSCFFS